MTTLAEIERAVLGLSQVEFNRLVEWLTPLTENRLRVAEPQSAYRFEPYPMTLEEYQDLQASSRIRHEYLAGEVIAMSGATPRHNRLTGRLYEAFSAHLKGGPCRSYMSEVQVRLRISRDDYVYYPDVMVVCTREREGERFFTDPKLIVEVLSPSTASVDRHEKRIAYRRIAALEEYIIVAQDAVEVTAFRREKAWEPVVLGSLDSVLELCSIDLRVPLALIYEGETMQDRSTSLGSA